MQILLTGGSGMLGRNLLEVAQAQGLEIAAPTRREMDLSSAESVRRYIASYQPELIIHCAGHVGGIQANIADPVGFLTLNLDMGTNLIRAAQMLRIPRVLNVGSSCMYPRNAPNPLLESAMLTGELEPTNEGYALAKIVTAKLCEYVSRQDPSFLYRTVIPCNLYGRHDHFEAKRSHLVPAIIQKVHQAKIKGEDSIELWGDGSARREFMFAEDAAHMILACGKRIAELPLYTNIGLGHDYSVLDYYTRAANVMQWSGHFEFDLSKPTGMKQKLVDTQTQQRLGLAPKVSLDEGLARTYQYFLDLQKHDH